MAVKVSQPPKPAMAWSGMPDAKIDSPIDPAHPASEHEYRAEGRCCAERCQADEDEAGRPRRPQPRSQAEIDDNQTEAGDEQHPADGKKPESGGQAASQSQKTREQGDEAGGQEAQSRQGPLLGKQGFHDEHRNELEQRTAHR